MYILKGIYPKYWLLNITYNAGAAPREDGENDGSHISRLPHLKVGCSCRVDTKVFWKTQSDTEANTSR